MRLARDRSAREHLLSFHLFRDGRGMHAAPSATWFYDMVSARNGWKEELVRRWFSGQTGLMFDENHESIGVTRTSYEGVPIVAYGCAACHAGKVLGQVVPGLGNKNIDPYALAALGRDKDAHHAKFDSRVDTHLRRDAARFCDRVADPRLGNLTQGLVSVAIIDAWFFREGGAPAGELARAAVKVPALWGYGEKRETGKFCSGLGDAHHPGWSAMVELVAGQRPETVRAYCDELADMEARFADLLPPAYPLEIDWELAAEGQTVFGATCQHCHGAYEKDEAYLPRFRPPLHIAIEDVGTDADRLHNANSQYLRLVATSPLAELIRVNPKYRPGYFAPRLEGIWARFPYLHNGSVPSITDLLEPAVKRPRMFSLRAAGEVERFDAQRLGLTVPAHGSRDEARLARQGQAGERDVYDVRRVGHGNHGHEFGTDLADTDKRAVIEYLKTL
jgi:cytochrome c5